MKRTMAAGLFSIIAALITVIPTMAGQLATGSYEGSGPKVYTKNNVPPTPQLAELPKKKSISQYGITWTFDKEAPVGQFITGDWYVVGPVTVVAIDPKPLFGPEEVGDLITSYEKKGGTKVARNGSMLNPKIGGDFDESIGPFDSRIPYSRYRGTGFAKLPIAMKPGDALYSTISKPNSEVDLKGLGGPHVRVIKTGAILTCLGAPQPADAFRPAMQDREQKIFLARNINRELLYKLPRPKALPQARTTPKVASWDEALDRWARIFQRPWVDLDQWGWLNPEENMPEYGQWVTHASSIAALLVHLDIPAEAKEKILVGYLQYAIDLWGQVRNGRAFLGHGGYGQGRKWPILFAGLLFGDEAMQHPEKTCPKVTFGEDMQTYDGKSIWGHDVVFLSHPINKGRRAANPDTQTADQWDNISNEGYRRCCTSINWVGTALAARIMRAREIWNHDPFFRYVDRWMTEDHLAELAKMAEGLKKNTKMEKSLLETYIGRYEKDAIRYKGSGYPRTDAFQQEMWDAYRNHLPPARDAAGSPEKSK